MFAELSTICNSGKEYRDRLPLGFGTSQMTSSSIQPKRVVRAFYFDIGGVLIEDKFGRDARKALLEIAQMQDGDPGAAFAAYTEMQPYLDSGRASLSDFCTAARLRQAEFEKAWLAAHPVDSAVLQVIERLLENGERVGLATNFCRQLLDLLISRNPVLDRLLICCSSDFGFVKPSREFFQRAEEIIDTSKVIFVDDRTINIQAARAIGWTAIGATGDWLREFSGVYL